MSVFNALDLLDSCSHYLFGEADFPELRLSFYHFPLAYNVDSVYGHLATVFDVLCASSISIDLPCPYCLRPYYCNNRNHHACHSLPLSRPLPYFINAAADLLHNSTAYRRWHNQDGRSLGNWLCTLDLGLDRALTPCICSPEIKWKWAAEIKGRKGNRFDRKYKCTVESKGAFEKSMKLTAELQGKGKYALLSRSSTQDICGSAKNEKKVERSFACAMEIDEEMNQELVYIRQALGKRSAHRSKDKKKEQSPQDAAMMIQRTFRDYMSRRSRVLHCLRDLAKVFLSPSARKRR